MIPGSNLLQQALSVIRPTTLNVYRYIDRSVNSIGLDVATYATPECIEGSVQALDRGSYSRLGLDYAKRHILIWLTAGDLSDLNRGRAPDQIGFNGRRYEIVDETDWVPIDGWARVIAVEIARE